MEDSYLIQILLKAKDDASRQIKGLQQAVRDLKAEAAGQDLSSALSDMGSEADRAAESHRRLAQEQERHRQQSQQSEATLQRQGKFLQEGADAANQHAESIAEVTQAHKDLQGESGRTEAAAQRVGRAHSEGAKAAAANAGAMSNAERSIAGVSAATDKLGKSQENAAKRGDELIQRMDALDRAARSRTATNAELVAGYQKVASGLRSVWNEFDIGSKRAEQFGAAMGRATAKAKNTDLARAGNGFTQFAQKLAGATDSIFPKIVSLSAELRGLRLIGLVGFAQPLITGLASLAGGLFSVASGAAQAGATLGGVFISGLGQLMPVLSVAVAGLLSLRNVMQAVSAAQAAQQEAAIAPNQGLINQLSTTNSLVSAEQSLANAYMAVKQAQEQLLESTLGITEARQNLLHAESTGSQDAIQQARLQLRSAQLSHQQAAHSLTQARQNVPQARRQIEIEKLTAAEPTSHESSQQATLNYLLGRMSPTEKKLFDQLNSFVTELKSPGSPLSKISDAFLQPFLSISTRLSALINDPSFLKPIMKLADAMGKAGDSLSKTIFGKGGTSFFETMAGDATKNIPIITKAIQGFIGVLRDIAKAAGPAFTMLSRDWANFWDKLSKEGNSKSGQKALTDFFNQGARWAVDFAKLAGAVVRLVGALAGKAAPQGMGTVTDLTKTVNGATKWVDQNGEKVKQFFQQARRGLSEIGSIVVAVGKQLLSVFSGSSLKNFTTLITTIVLPAVADFIKITGKLVSWFIKLVNILGPLRPIFEAGLGIAATLVMFGKLVRAITGVTKVIGGVHDAMKAFKDGEGILNRLSGAWDALTTRIGKGKTAINDAKKAQQDFADTTKTTDAEMVTENEAVDASEPSTVGGLGGAAKTGLFGTARGFLGDFGLLGAGATLYGTYEALKQTPGIGNIFGDGKGPKNAFATPSRGESERSYISQMLGLPGYTGPLTIAGVNSARVASGYASNPQAVQQLFQQISAMGHFGNSGFTPNNLAQQFSNLGSSLQKLKHPSDITKGQLQDIHTQIQNLLQQPDLTKNQRAGLQKLNAALKNTKGNLASLKSEIDKDSKIHGAHIPGSATGNWHSAVSGGKLTNVGEGGYDEVTLTTDPKYASRSGQLLARYLQRMATGGIPIIHRVAPPTQTIAGAGNTDSIVSMIVAAFLNSQGGKSSSLESFLHMPGKQSSSLLQKLAGTSPTSSNTPPSGSYSGSLINWLTQALKITKHYSNSNLMLLEGRAMQESGGNPRAINLWDSNAKAGHPSKGLLQTIDGTFDEYALPGYQNIWNPIDNAVAAIRYMFGRYGHIVGPGPGGYAKGGRILRALRSFASGGRAPWGGRAVPIIAHENERISNPGQWSHIAHLAGMSSAQLDHHMGYDSSHPKQFDAGGIVPYTATQGSSFAPKGTASLGNINSYLKNITTNLAQVDVGSVFGSLGTISQLASVINQAFSKITKLGGPQTKAGLNKISSLVETFADPNNTGSTLNQLSAAFQRFQNNLADWVTGLSYIGGLRTGRQVARPRRGGRATGQGDDLRLAGPSLTAGNIGSTGTTAIDLLNERSLVEQNSYLQGENKAVQDLIAKNRESISKVKSAQKNGAISDSTAKKALSKLDANYTELIQQQETLGQAINSTVTQRFQAEQQYVQDLVNQTNDIYQTQQTSLQSRQAGAQAMGAYGELPKIDTSLARSAKRQIQALQKPLKDAESQHDADATAQIKQQISELHETVTESTAQMVQDEMSGIQQAFQTTQAKQQGQQATAQALGQYGKLPNIDKAIAESAHRQIDALQKPLQEAVKSGNVGAANQIKQQISQLKETIGQSTAQMVQDQLSGLQQSFETVQAQQQAAQSGAQAMGNYNMLPSIDKAIAASAQSQINALQEPLQEAEKSHNTAAVASIKQQIAQLQETVTQSTAQMVQDALSGLQQQFQTVSAAQQSAQSSAQAMGNFSALIGPNGIDQQIIDTSNSQIAQYQTLLQQAIATGNTGAADQIKQAISQLQQTVAQTAAQLIQDSISAIQQTAQTQQAGVSMYQSIAQTMESNATTPGQFAAAGAENLAGLNLNQTSLQSQLSAYNTLLGQAINQGNTGAVATITQTIDQLTSELASNTQAIQDNTTNVISETSAYIQSRGQFQTGTLSGLAQIVTTIGQTTGYTDVGTLKALTSAQNASLQGTNQGLLAQLAGLGGGASGLASTLSSATTPQAFVAALSGVNTAGIEAGQDSTWVNTFETLLGNLESNTEAIATNNQQLAQLNGQLLQPQQWSTSAWANFREAIFSGMGNLLPQYQSTVAGTSAAPTIAPVFSPVASGSSPTIGVLNVNHAPVANFSAAIVGEQLAHEVTGALA